MSANITITPNVTTNAAGTFGISWDGLIQGTAYPDPSTRFALVGGILSSTETLPMWGGVGVYEDIPPAFTAPSPGSPIALGGNVGRALSITGGTKNLTGFSAFDQEYGAINTPQSPVPLVGSYGQVMMWRLGSGARFVVAMNAALVSLQGGLITQAVSWDFTVQELIPYVAAYSADTVSNATWNSTTGLVTITLGSGGELAVGDQFTLTGIVSTSPGSNGLSYNGTFVAAAGTTGTTLTYQGLPGSANNPGTYSSGGALPAGGGALPCKILRTYASGCMTVNQPDSNGNVSWNRNGAAAVIQI